MLLATLYASTIEMVFGVLVPIYSGFFILQSNMHLVTHTSWSVFKLSFVTKEHCGFNFPWHFNKCLPFGADSEYHDFHHSKNIGNFSQFTHLWDWLFGTEAAYTISKIENMKQNNQ